MLQVLSGDGGMEMKIKYFLILLFLLVQSAHGQDDVYQFCQTNIDIVKELSARTSKELVDLKSSIAAADSAENVVRAAGGDYAEVMSLLSKEGISDENAEKFMMAALKPLAMKNISLAISMQGVNDELEWNQVFDMCVRLNQDNF